jgi:hypothetical protein
MLNAGDINGAIIKLGGHVDKDRNILDLVTRKYTDSIDDKRNKINYYKNKNMPADEKQKKIKKLEDEIEHCQARIDVISKNIEDVKNSECPICCDNMDKPALLPCCNNMFCADCLIDWFQAKSTNGVNNKTCPACRHETSLKDMHLLSDETTVHKITTDKKDIETDIDKPVSKPETIMKVLKSIFTENASASVLIFSSYDNSFNEIETLLKTNDIKYTILMGNPDVINKRIQRYENKEYQVVLMNARFKGAGICLPTTSDIILYHQLDRHNPNALVTDNADEKLEKQVIGRAYRMGRSKDSPLNIHKLKYPNEYV